MNLETARRAVSLFFQGKKGSKLIRLFGGEPFLNFPVLKEVCRLADNEPSVSLDVTTNGLVLNNNILKFLEKQNNLEVILSSSRVMRTWNQEFLKKLLALPFLTVNLNLWPGELKGAARIFDFLVNLGFLSFNFLPAFYVPWSKKEISELDRSLGEIRHRIKTMKEIKVKNLGINSRVPLFDPAPAIDCSGQIYAGNIFLDKRTEIFKKELNLGRIQDINSWKTVSLPLEFDYRVLIKRAFPSKVLESTAMVDRSLTKFLLSL